MNPDWDQKALADHLKLDASSVTRLLSPSKCIQEVQDALRDGRITISDCYAISKQKPEDQPGMLAFRLSPNAGGRDALEQHGRKKRATSVSAVRASKIKVPLVGGATVTVAAEGVSMEEAA